MAGLMAGITEDMQDEFRFRRRQNRSGEIKQREFGIRRVVEPMFAKDLDFI